MVRTKSDERISKTMKGRLKSVFDASYYSRNYLTRADDLTAPFDHFLKIGLSEGNSPCALFDAEWYLHSNPDVAAQGMSPLLHYLSSGWSEMRAPHPIINVEDYISANPDIAFEAAEPLSHYLDVGWREGRKISELFDDQWYVEKYGSNLAPDQSPIAHFLESGWKKGQSPNPLFDIAWYIEQNPDVETFGKDPLSHFLIQGCSRGASPHALFDTDWYLHHNQDVQESGLNALEHFLRIGWKELRSPSPLFDVAWYLSEYPDIAQAGLNPLVHFVERGWREQRKPHPVFETSWYLQHNQDVADADLEPLSHFIRAGSFEERDPHPLFSVSWYKSENKFLIGDNENPLVHYLYSDASQHTPPHPDFNLDWYKKEYPEVDANQLNPLIHHIKYGTLIRPPDEREIWGSSEETEQTGSEIAVTSRKPSPNSLEDWQRAHLNAVFDEKYYRAQVGSVYFAGQSALDHYLAHGMELNADPNQNFSAAYYLERNPDVAATDMHPFVHYALAGKDEFRPKRHPLGDMARHLTNLRPPSDIAKDWITDKELEISNSSVFRDKIIAACLPSRPLIVAFSHDNYTEIVGGLQNCVRIEEQAFQQLGGAYLQISPAQPLPILASASDPTHFVLTLTLNGETLCHCWAGELTRFLIETRELVSVQSAILHSLMGFDLKVLSMLLHVCSSAQKFFWLHDFFSICPSYNLLRNGHQYCGAPSVESSACGICAFGEERKRVAGDMRDFFELHDFAVIAPSQAAADIWAETANLAHRKLVVHPHCTLVPSHTLHVAGRGIADDMVGSRPIRLAFLGYPSIAKGWSTFRRLVTELFDDPRYEFFHFGAEQVPIGATFRHVSVTKDNPDAMVHAIAENKIDVALVLSVWPETFCLTAHEAIAAGASLLCSSDGGNVADAVRARKCGLIYRDEDELIELLRGDRIENFVQERRRVGRTMHEIQYSQITADFVEIQSSKPKLTAGA